MDYDINNSEKFERSSRSAIRMSNRIGRKSPSRHSPSRKTSNKRSPKRSPARSPGRSPRSPGRSPARSPARTRAKSPNTVRKRLPLRNLRHAKISIPRIQYSSEENNKKTAAEIKNSVTEDSPTDITPLQYRLNELENASRRSMRMSSTPKFEAEHKVTTFIRNFDRAVSLPVERRTQLINVTDGKERGYSVQRDQILTKPIESKGNTSLESTILEKRKKEINLDEPQEWGGWIGTYILLFVLPLTVIAPQLLCSKDMCKLSYPEIPIDIRSYINISSFLGYVSFLFLLTIFSAIPIGKCIDGQQSRIGRLQYRMNGFLCAALSLPILSICVYKKVKLHDFILENSLQLSASGWILGTTLAIFLYMKANKAPVACLNMCASTNSVIYNFWQGREINPRIGSLDIKIILLRASVIGLIIVNWAVIVKALERSSSLELKDINLAELLVSSLQIFYGMDILIFESTILTSFEIMYEGTGYMICVGHLLYPFLPTILSRYMLYERTQINYFFIIPILSFIVGYIIYRISNSQKHEFRNNPLSPALDYLETISTPRGKKLIVSGLWGYVRHPNYFGDLIMQWSISSLSMATNILPYYAPICCTVVLLYRAIRDNRRCKIRYGYAWEQYCSKVKYMIINHIF